MKAIITFDHASGVYALLHQDDTIVPLIERDGQIDTVVCTVDPGLYAQWRQAHEAWVVMQDRLEALMETGSHDHGHS